jgi:hypothetical protein
VTSYLFSSIQKSERSNALLLRKVYVLDNLEILIYE